MPSSLPGPAYRIHTTRTVLRCWQPGDASLLKAAIDASLEHLRPWMPWAHYEPEALQTKIERLRRFRGEFDLGYDFVYGVFNLQETQVLGSTGLHKRLGEGAREIGYWIHKDYINLGLATEIAAALTKVAFTIDQMARVEIHCDQKNVRSAAIPRKLGFRHTTTLRQHPRSADSTIRDTMIWTLLAHEYPSTPAAASPITAFDVAGRLLG